MAAPSLIALFVRPLNDCGVPYLITGGVAAIVARYHVWWSGRGLRANYPSSVRQRQGQLAFKREDTKHEFSHGVLRSADVPRLGGRSRASAVSPDDRLGGNALRADAELQGFKAGDPKYFAQLFAQLTPQLRRRARELISDPDAIDDVVQETWIRAYATREQFANTGSLGGWIWRICRNVSCDWTRAERIRVLVLRG